MPTTSLAAKAVASVRDMLSQPGKLPEIIDRLRHGAIAERHLDQNPPQPRRLARQPLTGPTQSTEFIYQDGSRAILQRQLPNPFNPNHTSLLRAWVAARKPLQPSGNRTT